MPAIQPLPGFKWLKQKIAYKNRAGDWVARTIVILTRESSNFAANDHLFNLALHAARERYGDQQYERVGQITLLAGQELSYEEF